MAELIIFIAILNLGLGFAAAAFLGRRYRLSQLVTAGSASSVAVTAREPEVRPSSHPAAAEPSFAASDAPPTEPAPSATAIQQFHAEVEQYHARMVTIDDQLRQDAVGAERDTVEACLQELRMTTEEYVRNRDEAQRKLPRSSADTPKQKACYNLLEAAVGNETRQIEATTAVMAAFDQQPDLGQGCRQLVEQTDRLLEANLALRDAITETMDDGLVGPAASLDPPNRGDQAAGTLDRAAAGNMLAEWCAGDTQQPQPMAAALVDLDQFAMVNRQYGHGLGDRILKEVAALLLAERPDGLQVSRLQGNTFLILFPNTDARAAANFVERVRQTMEQARFRRQDVEVRLTLSGAITQLRSGDAPESLLARLRTTLALAKRYGRNRCFLHEGEYPSPVIPPAFALTEKEILL